MADNEKSQTNIRGFLAILVSLGFFAVLAILLLIPTVSLPSKDLLLVMLGALLAGFKEVLGWYYGSSSGSAKKDETIAAQAVTNAMTTPQQAVSTTDTPNP